VPLGSSGGSDSDLASLLISGCNSAISLELKAEFLNEKVFKSISERGRVDLNFNRPEALRFFQDVSRGVETKARPLIDQLYAQAPSNDIANFVYRTSGDHPLWHVDAAGEGGIDAGGPGREFFTVTCLEAMEPGLGLFVPTPNTRNGTNAQGFLIPAPGEEIDSDRARRLEMTGLLMGLTFPMQQPVFFRFARFVWAYLCGHNVGVSDVYEVDTAFRDLMQQLEAPETLALSEAQFEDQFQLRFTCENAAGKVVPLMKGGAEIVVTKAKREEYVHRCQKMRVAEMEGPLEALKKGFNRVFGGAQKVLAPWELEKMICGDTQCPVSEMKKNINVNGSSTQCEMLWRVLESFTPEERMLFIKFGSGRMGLPAPGTEWKTKLRVEFRSDDGRADKDKKLPTAATCSSKIEMVSYNTDEWMAKKLRAAITLTSLISDHDPNMNTITDF